MLPVSAETERKEMVILMNKNYWKSSALALKSTQNLVLCAVFLALLIVMRMHLTFYVGTIRVTFEFLMYALAGLFFGPVTGIFFGAAADLLGFLANGGGFSLQIGYTFVAMLRGFLFGLLLYRGAFNTQTKPLHIVRIILAKVTDTLIINILINPFFRALYGTDTFWVNFSGTFVTGLIKNLIMLPVEILLLIAVVRIVEKNRKYLRFGRSRQA